MTRLAEAVAWLRRSRDSKSPSMAKAHAEALLADRRHVRTLMGRAHASLYRLLEEAREAHTFDAASEADRVMRELGAYMDDNAADYDS